MSKKDNWSEQKFVYSETDLKDAMQEEFGRIIVRGEIANPEGVSFSILLMNILNPYICEWTKTKPFGGVQA